MTTKGSSVPVWGAAVGVLGVIVIPLLQAPDILRVIRHSGRWPGQSDMIGIAFTLAVYMIPSALIAVGAYLFAASGKPAGRVMVSAGCFVLVALFLLMTFCGGYAALYMIGPRFLLTLLAVLTWVAAGRATPEGEQGRGGARAA